MDAFLRDYRPFVEQVRLYEDFAPPAKESSAMLGEAQAFACVYPCLTPVIHDGELIVGARLRGGADSPGYDFFSSDSATMVDYLAQGAPANRSDIQAMAARGLISPASSLCHKVVDYAGFIRTGSVELVRRARLIADQHAGEKSDFASAFAIGHAAMVEHAQTYVRACRELAKSASPDRAAELEDIARICDKVPAYPADTFREALQSFWFAYMVAGDGIGRIDVYLNDFYQADLAAGRITPDEALELIECLMVKIHGDATEGFVNISSVQTMTLGGQLPDGSDATSDLTRMFLAAVRNVRLLRPTVYLRCHTETPQDVLELAVDMLAEGLAEPHFYGDAPIVDGLTRVGIPVDVARDYALSGCTEVVSPGRSNWGAPNGWINIALMVDDVLRERALDPDPTSESIWDAISRKTEEIAEACRVSNMWIDEQCASPYYSSTLLMPTCLDRCLDVAHGGAETNIGHWEAIGLPNAANMIYSAIHLLSSGQTSLSSAFAAIDGQDSEFVSNLRNLPKFGNDCQAVDEVASRLILLLSSSLERRSTPFRQTLVLGHLAGVESMHIAYGLSMGPTLDGRRAGQTLADSLAGSQGSKSGPTALLRSVCRIDHSRLIAGNSSTLGLSPNDLRTSDDRTNVVGLIRAFVAMGGSQLQVNVTDAETLRNAQAHPEDYGALLVRVAGYSAYFTSLEMKLQNEIIARIEGLD